MKKKLLINQLICAICIIVIIAGIVVTCATAVSANTDKSKSVSFFILLNSLYK